MACFYSKNPSCPLHPGVELREDDTLEIFHNQDSIEYFMVGTCPVCGTEYTWIEHRDLYPPVFQDITPINEEE